MLLDMMNNRSLNFNCKIRFVFSIHFRFFFSIFSILLRFILLLNQFDLLFLLFLLLVFFINEISKKNERNQSIKIYFNINFKIKHDNHYVQSSTICKFHRRSIV